MFKLLSCCVILLSAVAGGAVLSNQQLSCTITQDGIQSIALAGRVITTQPSEGFPAHQGFYASRSFPALPGTASLGTRIHSTVTSANDGVTIDDAYSNMAMQYSYRLSGSDIELRATLQNHDTLPLHDAMIALPTFAFGSDVTGDIKSWDASYLMANSTEAHHPGIWCPLAVSYARDSNYGVALHCKSHFDSPTLFEASRFTANGVPTVADITLYLWDVSVAPGGKLVVDITIHLTTQTDLASLVSSYVRDFRAFAGAMRYQPDDRPWLRFTSFDQQFVTPQDPLGYNGDTRRFDTPLGIQRFEDMVYPSVGVTQGTIFWQPQGFNPRGGQYRPDFDVWPQSVAANLPGLIQWYKSMGLKFGLCARCGKYVEPAGPVVDAVKEIDGNNPAQMATLLSRFDAVQKLGVNAYYMDDLGTDLNSYHIVRQVREHIGPGIPTYTEFTSDLLLPYSGVYTELNPHGKGGGPPNGGTRWYGPDTLAIFRMLYPQSGIITANVGDTSGRPIVRAAQLARWKLTPIAEDFQARDYRSFFQDFVQNYLQGILWK